MTSGTAATAHDEPGPIYFNEYGLSAFTFRGPWCADDGRTRRPPIMPTHNHLEVELILAESGGLTVEFSGTTEEVRPFEPVLFWGGVPHRALRAAVGSVFHVAQVPLVDLLSWPDSASMLQPLLDGGFLREPPAHEEAAVERLMFARWSRDLRSTDPDLRRPAELEIEARFRRFLTRVGVARSSRRGTDPVPANHLAAVTRFVAAHFNESITVDDVAAAVGWHRDHLMSSFRRSCGMTLWAYVTRLRLAEAQRLLTATDLPVMEVCHRAGFGSISQMYDVFKRYRDTTPAQYRQTATARGPG